MESEVVVLDLSIESPIGDAFLVHGEASHVLALEVPPDVFKGSAVPYVHSVLSSCADVC